ncbi:MAG: SpoIVB peptidase S55 domain-containing protein [Bacillota bacterium]|nr:SpoIVB peptidase S55 domain-containing protein [Bacillota bacterium]
MIQPSTCTNLRRATRALAFAVALTVIMVLAGMGAHVPAGASQNQAFISIGELRPGMKGIGKTVVEGTRIDTFDVQVLGVLKGETATGDLVLVRVSGKPVEAAGGIAAGMSGSPVYVNGRLVGAIAFGFESADHFVGLVTPIEEMLKVFAAAKRPVPKLAYLSSPVRVGDRLAKRVVLARSAGEAAHLAAAVSDDTLVMVPVATPVMVSGASKRAFERLSRRLRDFSLMPVQGGGGGARGAEGETALEPGSSIGVQLVRGDVSVTAIGTVTYRQGDEVLAFGHPLLGRGNSTYFATGAEVHLVVNGEVMPFKVASPLGLAGTIVQDRTHGVLVDVGKKPPSIPVTVTVRDRDTGVTRMLRADIVRDDMLSTDLAGVFTLSCLDATVDRIGRGTSRVSFHVDGKGLPNPIVRDNMFYSPADISADSIGELVEAVATVIDNEFADVEVTGVKADFDVEEARRTARIHQAEAAAKVVKPGDTLEVKVRLLPFRGIPEIKIVKVQIPDGTPPGTLYVTVRGGGVPPVDEEKDASGAAGAATKSAQPSVAESLDKLVQDFMSRERNNDIVVEFYPGEASPDAQAVPVNSETSPGEPVGSRGLGQEQGEEPPRGDGKPQRAPEAAAGAEETGVVKATLTTGYVIEGETTVEVEVEDSGPGTPAGAPRDDAPPEG